MTKFFDIILVPLGYLVEFCNKLIPNYALSLILVALALRLLLFPFGIKQQKNSIKQASLQPKERAIRKKYAGRTDKPTQMKMNEEIQKLYQEENFNMFGGCLPLLLQFPILIALYTVIRTPLQYIMHLSTDLIDKLEVFFLQLVNDGKLTGISDQISKTISGLSEEQTASLLSDASSVSFSLPQIDMISSIRANENLFTGFFNDINKTISDLPNFSLFGLDLGKTPSFSPETPAYWWLLIIPALTFVILFFSTKLTRRFTYQPAQTEDAARSMKIMDFAMPLFSVWITFSVPAVIGVYWIYQNVFTTLQQIILSKIFPLPKFTEEDFKEAERKYAGTLPKKEKKAVRSLHHIDDDDFDKNGNPIPPAGKKQEDPTPEGPVGKAPLKEDRKSAGEEPEKPEKKKVRSLHHIDDDDFDEHGNPIPQKEAKKDPSSENEKTPHADGKQGE